MYVPTRSLLDPHTFPLGGSYSRVLTDSVVLAVALGPS